MSEFDVQDTPPEGAPEWMVTFADLMSLLLTFFVLLLSFSNMEIVKFRTMAGSVPPLCGWPSKAWAMSASMAGASAGCSGRRCMGWIVGAGGMAWPARFYRFSISSARSSSSRLRRSQSGKAAPSRR